MAEANRRIANNPEKCEKLRISTTYLWEDSDWRRQQTDARANPEYRENLRSNHLVKKYKIVSPYGDIFDVDSLKQFCKDNNLSYSHMSQVVNHRGNRKQHKGWTGEVVEFL
jgi:hypothetical protein